MKLFTRFAGFAVALLLAGAAFAAGSPAVGKESAPVEKTFAKTDAAAVENLTLTNAEPVSLASTAVAVAEWQACVSSGAIVSVASATLGDQLLTSNLAGAEHYAREPDRMTVAPVARNSQHVKQPPAISVFAIPEPGGRASDVLAQLTSCNPDFRRT